MSKTTSINLGDHFSSFIDHLMTQGRYASTSEVVRAGLRLLEEHEASMHALRTVMTEDDNSGASAPFASDLVHMANKKGLITK